MIAEFYLPDDHTEILNYLFYRTNSESLFLMHRFLEPDRGRIMVFSEKTVSNAETFSLRMLIRSAEDKELHWFQEGKIRGHRREVTLIFELDCRCYCGPCPLRVNISACKIQHERLKERTDIQAAILFLFLSGHHGFQDFREE